MIRLAVTGASGLLGSMVTHRARSRFALLALTRSRGLRPDGFETASVELTHESEVNRVLDAFRPEVVVHCAALTQVDQAERAPEEARRQNAEVPALLAHWCRREGARLVHVSTDAVFSGERGGYREEDDPAPPNVYGRTKWEGELRVLEALPDSVVVRTNLIGWGMDGPAALVGWILARLRGGEEVPGWTDVRFNPLFTGTLADLLLELAEREARGVLHVAARGPMSKYEFARDVARRWGFDPDRVRPTRAADQGLAAPRSPDTTLAVGRAEALLGRAFPTVRAEIEAMHRFGDEEAEALRALALDDPAPPQRERP